MKYRYVLKYDAFYKTTLQGVSFSNEWISIFLDGTIEIKRGYAWDGCTPSWKIGKFYFGTPEGKKAGSYPKTYFASLLHDAIYQFKQDIPLSRKDADKSFYYALKIAKFGSARLYYGAVRLMGRVMGKWKCKTYHKFVIFDITIYNL